MPRKKIKIRKIKKGTKIIAPSNMDKVKIIKLLDNEKSQIVLQCDKNHSCIIQESITDKSLLVLDNGTIIVGEENFNVDDVLNLAGKMIDLYNTVDFNPVQLSLIDEFVEVVLELLLYSANLKMSDSIDDVGKLIKTIELIENSDVPQMEEIDYIINVLKSKLKTVNVVEYRSINDSLLMIRFKDGNILIVGNCESIDNVITALCEYTGHVGKEGKLDDSQGLSEPDYFQYQEPESIDMDSSVQVEKELPDVIREQLSKVFE